MIGKYEYVYGAGSTPNRKIEFYENRGIISAKLQGKIQGKWEDMLCANLDEKHIIKEGASTTDKVRIMLESRKNNKSPTYPSDKTFCDLQLDEKKYLISKLEPEGEWKIEISNTIGADSRFEEIKSLRFFNPS